MGLGTWQDFTLSHSLARSGQQAVRGCTCAPHLRWWEHLRAAFTRSSARGYTLVALDISPFKTVRGPPNGVFSRHSHYRYQMHSGTSTVLVCDNGGYGAEAYRNTTRGLFRATTCIYYVFMNVLPSVFQTPLEVGKKIQSTMPLKPWHARSQRGQRGPSSLYSQNLAAIAPVPTTTLGASDNKSEKGSPENNDNTAKETAAPAEKK